MKTIVKFLITAMILMLVVPIPSETISQALSNPVLIAFVVPVSIVSIAFLAYLFANRQAINARVNGIQVEIWVKYIIERLFKDSQFLQHAASDDDYVLQGKIVHIPQPGAKPVVVKNRSAFPAATVQRTDTEINYSLDTYTTDPTHIPFAEKSELSYDKMDSVFGDHMAVLSELVADDMLIKWATNATDIVRTTGGPAVGTVPGVNGQTTTRKGFHHKDLQKVMILMNTKNVRKDGRKVLIDDNMFDFFYDSLSDNAQRLFSEYVDAKNGIVGRLHGFDIMTRSSVLAASSADVLNALGAAIGATDNLISLAWQKDTVARALGNVEMFQDVKNPLYYGDIYSALVKMGGRVRRADAAGIVKITQAP
jgi:hypothetical protein